MWHCSNAEYPLLSTSQRTVSLQRHFENAPLWYLLLWRLFFFQPPIALLRKYEMRGSQIYASRDCAAPPPQPLPLSCVSRSRGTGIHRRMSKEYGENFMSDGSVREWCRKFKEGRTDVHYEGGHGRKNDHTVPTSQKTFWKSSTGKFSTIHRIVLT
jgi:hypothetical protein